MIEFGQPIYILSKGHEVKFSEHLKHSEIMCKCLNKDCTTTTIYVPTLKSFELLRNFLNMPLVINSGYRCQKHNAKVGGLDNSFHKLGAALDIQVPDGMSIGEFTVYCNRYFDITIPYASDNFVHCHNLIDLKEL